MPKKSDIVSRLEATIAGRLKADPKSSYIAKLAAKGETKMACKLGEEATETIVAALAEDKQALTSEAADLMFHLLVLLGHKGVKFDDVLAELAQREGVSGLDEKAARSD